MIMLSVENSLVFLARAKATAFGCCEPSPTTQCNTGLFGVGIGKEVGINFYMTSAMWGPLGHNIMNLFWSLSDKGTRVRFCWVPSHCGIDGNERVDQLAKETLDQDIDPLVSVHYTDMKPLVNSYIQKLVQTKWDVAVHCRDLYLVKPTLGPPKKFQRNQS